MTQSRAWSWRHAVTLSNLTGECRHLLLTMSIFMNEEGGSCFPEIATLMERTGKGKTWVHKYLNEAEKAGWLLREQVSRKKKNGDNRGWRRNEYQASWPDENDVVEVDSDPEKGGSPDELPSKKVVRETVEGSSREGKKVVREANTNSPITFHDSHNAQNCADGADAPERENFENEDLKKEDPKKVEQAFKRFFPNWPTYVSDSEPAARNAWNSLEPHEREQAADRMDDYLAAVKASDRKMVCSCARYLSEQRWTKLPPARAKSAQSHPSSFPAFGIGWMALRLWALGQARKPWSPTAMQQKMIDQGVSVDDARHRGEFPLVASMDADSEYGKPVLSSMPFEKLDTDGYVQIKAGSEEWYAWQAWHEQNDYPPLPMPKGKERFVWVPSVLPQGLNETQPAEAESEGSDEYSAL